MKTKDVVDFIRKIYGQKSGFLGLQEPVFIGNEKKYVSEAIDSTYVSAMGKYVNLVEEFICDFTGAKYAVAVVNGTSALHLSLKVVGVRSGDEVLTQPLTFVATANAISYLGATPHFVDVDKDTMGMSPTLLDQYLSKNTKQEKGRCVNIHTGKVISACVPMHTMGLPLRIDEVVEVCNKYSIIVVEDTAESLGSVYKGKHTGTFGKIAAFSFNGNKIVTAGGGGLIITEDEVLAKEAKHLSTQAKKAHIWEFNHDAIGFNYRMPNLNAALLYAQFENLNNFIKNKRDLASIYQEFFKSQEDYQYIKEIEGAKSNYWLHAILCKDFQNRNQFLEESNELGVMSRPIWTLMNKLDMFKECPSADLTNAIWLEERVVNITSTVRLKR